MAFIYKYYDKFLESEVPLSLQGGRGLDMRCLSIEFDSSLSRGVSASTEYEVQKREIAVKSEFYAAVLDIKAGKLRLNIFRNLPVGTITQLLIDEVFPVVSFLDGALQLHASSVCRQEVATCFLGHSGAGKSSLAVSMMSQGYELIDDDRVLLRPMDRAVKVFGNVHPLRLVRGCESCFDLGNWQDLGVASDGKLLLVPPVDRNRSSGICQSIVLMCIGQSFHLGRSKMTEHLLPVLECIPLSWFFSEHFGENFMKLLQELFGSMLFISLVRRSDSDPLFVGSEIEAFLKKEGSETIFLESSERFV